jgi:hypothetical protein
MEVVIFDCSAKMIDAIALTKEGRIAAGRKKRRRVVWSCILFTDGCKEKNAHYSRQMCVERYCCSVTMQFF